MSNTTPEGGPLPAFIQDLFTRIATRYDLLNRLMTAGQDVLWRKTVIRLAALSPNARLLDIGAGTGGLAHEALRQHPHCHPIAADFTLEMMRIGMRHRNIHLHWTAADALYLPFPDATFDAVVSGFLLRNVSDIHRCLHEQHRTLKPGGVIVALDTTQPPRNWFLPLINFYLHHVVPNLGRIFAGDRKAYDYLSESTLSFLPAGQLAQYMISVGFREVGFFRYLFAAIAIHWGTK